MGGDRTIRGLVSASPEAVLAVRRVVAAWRRLTGTQESQRKTLVACSGGVDSMALSVALASASPEVVVGHVVHDMRPRAEAIASRDAAEALAHRIGATFVVREIAVRGEGGNYESAARTRRYEALSAMAKETSCAFVATGHHADDQLETVLMRLLRGSGPKGLGGLARKRRLSPAESAWLIRPMLTISRRDTEQICRTTATAWVEDATNQDLGSFRNALRHRVLPILSQLAPRGPHAAVATAELMRQVSSLIAAQAQSVVETGEFTATPSPEAHWTRDQLRNQEPVVLSELVRQAAQRLGVQAGADRRGARAMEPILAAMRDESTQPREFSIGGLWIRVDAHAVVIRPLPSSP